MEENMQKRLWKILIENELYKLLEFAKDKNQREQFIKEFSVENEIPIDFINEKLEKMNKVMKDIKGKDYEER